MAKPESKSKQHLARSSKSKNPKTVNRNKRVGSSARTASRATARVASNSARKTADATRKTAKTTRATVQKAGPVVRTAVNKANKKLTVAMAAWILSAATFVSMIAGLWRDRLLNTNFGAASRELDAYRVAFEIPDFMYIILVSGALSVTFIPVFRDRLETGNKKSAWELTYSLINFLAMMTSAASILIMVFAPQIVSWLAPHLADDPEIRQTTINMMRLVSLNPLIFGVSAVLASVQQAVGRFVFYSLSPVVYNLGIIIGIVYLSPHYGIQGVVYGVLLGALVQLSVSILGMAGLGFQWRPLINRRNLGFRQVIKLLPSRSFDQGMDYVRSLFEVALLSRIAVGAVNQWKNAYNLHTVPVSLIGVALSTAVFPQMSKRISQNRPDLFRKDFQGMLHVIIWLALPVAMFAFLGRGYLVRLLVGDGEPTVAYLLGILSISIFFRAVFHIVSRAFYAQKDIKTPLLISLVTIVQSVVLAIIFVNLGVDNNSKIAGVALAQSISNATEVILLLLVLEGRFRGIFDRGFLVRVLKVVAAVILTVPMTYLMIRIVPLRADDVGFFSLSSKFGIIVGMSAMWYLLISWQLKIREVDPIIEKLRSIFFTTHRIR